MKSYIAVDCDERRKKSKSNVWRYLRVMHIGHNFIFRCVCSPCRRISTFSFCRIILLRTRRTANRAREKQRQREKKKGRRKASERKRSVHEPSSYYWRRRRWWCWSWGWKEGGKGEKEKKKEERKKENERDGDNQPSSLANFLFLRCIFFSCFCNWVRARNIRSLCQLPSITTTTSCLTSPHSQGEINNRIVFSSQMMKLILLVFLLCAHRHFAQQGSIEWCAENDRSLHRSFLFFSFRFGTVASNCQQLSGRSSCQLWSSMSERRISSERKWLSNLRLCPTNASSTGDRLSDVEMSKRLRRSWLRGRWKRLSNVPMLRGCSTENTCEMFTGDVSNVLCQRI